MMHEACDIASGSLHTKLVNDLKVRFRNVATAMFHQFSQQRVPASWRKRLAGEQLLCAAQGGRTRDFRIAVDKIAQRAIVFRIAADVKNIEQGVDQIVKSRGE